MSNDEVFTSALPHFRTFPSPLIVLGMVWGRAPLLIISNIKHFKFLLNFFCKKTELINMTISSLTYSNYLNYSLVRYLNMKGE
jgi:hypothetical protein